MVSVGRQRKGLTARRKQWLCCRRCEACVVTAREVLRAVPGLVSAR